MTTKATKGVSRETSAIVMERGARPLIVTLNSSTLQLRPKGLKATETVGLVECYHLAVRQRVFSEKTQAKKASKK